MKGRKRKRGGDFTNPFVRKRMRSPSGGGDSEQERVNKKGNRRK